MFNLWISRIDWYPAWRSPSLSPLPHFPGGGNYWKWECCPSATHHHHPLATGQIYQNEKDIILDKTDLYKIETVDRFNEEKSVLFS